jgi:thermitase
MRLISKAFYLVIVFAVCVLALTSGGRTTRAQAKTARENGYVPDQVVVKLAPDANVAQVASDFGLDPKPLKQFGSRPIYQLHILDGTDPQVKSNQLAADLVRVVYAEPNFLFDAPEETGIIWSVGNGYSFVAGGPKAVAAQWAWKTTGLGGAQQVSRGAGVTVAVLDTGVDLHHPALAGHLVPGYDFVDGDNDPSESGDIATGPFGHGTHVAGLIATVAPDAKIMPLRVLDQNGEGNVWVLAEAIAYAADPDGDPSTPDGAQVINLSIATLRRTQVVRDIIKIECSEPADSSAKSSLTTFGAGIVVVTAAGNGASNVPEYPAAETGVNEMLAVAASDSNDHLAAFSTFGSWIGVMAPGDGIVSSVPHNHYALWRGTSMAAPIVAGQAALVRATFPNLTAKKVVQQITDTAHTTTGEIRSRIDIQRSVTDAPGQ